MKTKYLYLTAIFFVSLSPPLKAQNEASALGGLQSSVNEFAGAAAETIESLSPLYDESIRRYMIFGSDIRMWMNADFEAEHIYYGAMGLGALFSSYVSAHKGSLYAKFDWQNMAESIRARSTESIKRMNIGPYSKHGINEAIDHTMYVDAQGLWYVPVEMEGNEVYVRVNLADQIQNMANTLEFSIDAAIAAGATEMIDQLLAAMLTMDLGALGVGSFFPMFPPNILAALEDPNIDVAGELLSSMTPLLQAQIASQLQNINSLPPLIHFAIIISPTLARSRYNPQEATVSWRGQDNCTRMTLPSGYLVVFDQFGRLIHLKDTDGGTADYKYDMDVTVNIPPAMDMGSFMPGMSSD